LLLLLIDLIEWCRKLEL